MWKIVALQKYGKKWKLIQREIPGRTAPQIRAHAQKFFIKLSRFKPEAIDVISYIKKTPIDTLINIPSQNNPNGFDSSSSDIFPNPIPMKSEEKRADERYIACDYCRQEEVKRGEPFNDTSVFPFQSEVIAKTLHLMNNNLNELYKSLGDDITRIMVMPVFSHTKMKYWVLLKDLCERLKRTFTAIMVCQQQSLIQTKLVVYKNY